MTTVLRERAENLSFDELRNVNLANNLLLFHLDDYFSNNIKRPELLIGGKGGRKTLNTMKALSGNAHKDENFLPVMFVYEQQKRLNPLSPERLATPKVWGSRFEKLQSTDRRDLIDAATTIVHDDFHYIFEDLVRGKGSLDQVTSDLEDLSGAVDEGKKVLLISENPLSAYAEKLSKRMNTERLEEVLLKFGQPPYYKAADDPKKYYEIGERTNYLAFREVPPLSQIDWLKLFDVYDVNVENPIQSFIYESSSKPRAFVKFAKLFQKNEGEPVKITVVDMERKAVELLPQHTTSPQQLKHYYYLLNFQKVPISKTITDTFSISDKTIKMKHAYHNFSNVKSVCKDLLSSFGVAREDVNYEDMHLLSEKKHGDRVEFFIALNNLEKKLKDSVSMEVEEVMNDPLLFNFLQTFDIFERRKKDYEESVMMPEKEQYKPGEPRKYKKVLRRELDLNSELNDHEHVLISELNRFDYNPSKDYNATRNYFVPWHVGRTSTGELEIEGADYLFLRRPLQKAFEDQLYETPTLEVLDAFAR